MDFEKLIKEIFNLSYFKPEGKELEKISQDFSLILSYVDKIKKIPIKSSLFFFHEKKKVEELRGDDDEKKINFSLEKIRRASPFTKDNFFLTKKIL